MALTTVFYGSLTILNTVMFQKLKRTVARAEIHIKAAHETYKIKKA